MAAPAGHRVLMPGELRVVAMAKRLRKIGGKRMRNCPPDYRGAGIDLHRAALVSRCWRGGDFPCCAASLSAAATSATERPSPPYVSTLPA